VRVDVAPGGGIAVRRLGGAPLRWDEVPVDCGGADVARTGLLGPVVEALDAQRRRVTADDDPDAPETLAIGCRLVLTGRVRDRRALRQALARADLVGFVHPDAAGGPPCFVEHVSDRTRPAVDLEELARSPAPPGLLAERLLALERDDEAGRTLVRRAAESLLRVHEDPAWRDLHASRPTADEVRGLLLTAGRDALDELLAQAGPEGEAGGGAEGGSGRGPEGGAR
jgi:hypothetical protein